MSERYNFKERLKTDPVLREWYARMPTGPLRKPKPVPAVVAEVSEKFAEAVKGNPEGVRLSVRAKDETVVVERPRRSEVVQVQVQGRLTGVWDQEASGGFGTINGRGSTYPGERDNVARDWDPIKRFEEGFGE